MGTGCGTRERGAACACGVKRPLHSRPLGGREGWGSRAVGSIGNFGLCAKSQEKPQGDFMLRATYTPPERPGGDTEG